MAPAMGSCGLASSSLSVPEGGVDGLGNGSGVVGLGGEDMAVVGVPWLMGCWPFIGVRSCGVACLGGGGRAYMVWCLTVPFLACDCAV